MAAIGTKEAAARLGLTPRRVRQLIKAGLIRAKKIGRDWTVTETAIDAASTRPNRRGRRKGGK